MKSRVITPQFPPRPGRIRPASRNFECGMQQPHRAGCRDASEKCTLARVPGCAAPGKSPEAAALQQQPLAARHVSSPLRPAQRPAVREAWRQGQRQQADWRLHCRCSRQQPADTGPSVRLVPSWRTGCAQGQSCHLSCQVMGQATGRTWVGIGRRPQRAAASPAARRGSPASAGSTAPADAHPPTRRQSSTGGPASRLPR